MTVLKRFIIAAVFLAQTSCATHTKTIVAGMLVGAAAGAAIGNQFDDHGDSNQKDTNTIVSALVTSLIVGGALEWHYQELAAQTEQISGRYARMRLCDPDEMKSGMAGQFDLNREDKIASCEVGEKQLQSSAIVLDDNTKWAFPTFRKRFLQPETGETQMTSERYIWEIMKPGKFVTRSQNPQYFFEVEKK